MVKSSYNFFYKRKLINETKTYLEQNFFLFIVKFKKLGFSAPLKVEAFPLSALPKDTTSELSGLSPH